MFGKKAIGLVNAPKPSAQDARFDVTPSFGKSLMGAAFFVACSLLGLAEAGRDGSLTINYVVTLDPAGAQVFWILFALVALGMAVVGIKKVIRSFGEPVWLVLGSASISGPKSYVGSKTASIPFHAIKRVDRIRVRENEFIEIVSHDGEKIKVGSANFRARDDWSVFIALLGRRVSFFR